MKLLILATCVFSKITRERGVGQNRTDYENGNPHYDATCYLREIRNEALCCEGQDDDCVGCKPVRHADGEENYYCIEQENTCFCDEACITIGDCCPDHNYTCSYLQDNPYTPSTTVIPTTTEDNTTTNVYTTSGNRTTTTTAPPSCTGFVQMPVHSLMTWKRAKRVCRLLGGQLAYFENETELDSFYQLDLEVTSWLGMLRNKNGKHFIDVANREKIQVANWNNGEPNNHDGDERCVVTFTDGKWNDSDCREVNQVICRFEDPIYC